MRHVCVTVAMVVACSFGTAMATTTTFTGNGGTTNWHTGANWDNGVPTLSVDAIIPASKTCIISTANGEARTVSIATSGILRIDSYTLTIEAPSDATYHVEINGRLESKKSGENDPKLLASAATVSNPFRICGAGTADAGEPDFGPARIEHKDGGTMGLAFICDEPEVLTLRGSFIFDFSGEMELHYTHFIVDHSGDTMQLGSLASGGSQGGVSGAGTLKVSAGELVIGRRRLVAPLPPLYGGWQGKIRVEGTGLFHVTDLIEQQAGRGRVEVAGRTLQFDTNWANREDTGKHLIHTGGTIKVKSGKLATFE